MLDHVTLEHVLRDVYRVTPPHNKIHAQLLMHGTRIQDASPFSSNYNAKLKMLRDHKVDGYLNILNALNSEIEDASKTREEAEEDESAKLLATIPGVGYYSALLITSEAGDVNRFPDSAHLCSYAGLTPSTAPLPER